MAWCSHGTLWLAHCTPSPSLASHHSSKAAVKKTAYYSPIGFFYFLGGWQWHFGLDELRCSALHGLWFNVITQWNSSTREEMCPTWVCLYVCVCDRVWEVSEWITLASPTLGRKTLLVLSMREHQLLSKVGSLICNVFLLTPIYLCSNSRNSCSMTKEHKQIWQMIYLYSPRSVQPVCIILSRLAMVYIHPMNLWSFNGQWATGNSLDRFDSFMAYELQSFIFIHHLNSNLFVYPGASHRLLDRLGLSWWV